MHVNPACPHDLLAWQLESESWVWALWNVMPKLSTSRWSHCTCQLKLCKGSGIVVQLHTGGTSPGSRRCSFQDALNALRKLIASFAGKV